MKILLSAYACEPGKGSEPEVGWHWALELSKLSYNVWVLTRSNNKSAIEKAFSKRNQPKNLYFIYYDLPAWIRRLKKGRRFVHFYYLLWQLGAYRTAKKLHIKIQFDLVHHVTFASVRQPSFMGGLGIPFVFGPVAGGETAPLRLRFHYGVRGFLIDAFRDLINFSVKIDPLMWITFRQAKKIHVTSEKTKNLIPSCFHHKVSLQLAIGVESIGENNLPLKTKRENPRILYVGQFIYWKGMGLGIRAFYHYSKNIQDARLTVVGKGPDEKKFRKLAAKLKIEQKVNWIPWVERDKLSEIYHQHDVFLYPSLHDSGGMVVLEAMAHGLPVVCLDLGGPGSIVNNSCGIKISVSGRSEQRVIADLSNALYRITIGSTPVHTIRNGITEQIENFYWDKIVKKIYLKDKN